MTTVDIIRWIASDELWRFYTSRTWKRIRREVMIEYHGECQDCKARGKYTPATMVHHEQHLKDRPDLAIVKYYVDESGQRRRQLTPLCDECHDTRHPERLWQNKPAPEPWPERWD